MEINRLPAKKLFSKNWQQSATLPSARPTGFGAQSTSTITPLNLPHSTTTSSPRSNDEKMDTSDDELHDEDSPLDMRIPTKQDSDDSGVRPSVIRRAPSFKETSNSPFENQTASGYLLLNIFRFSFL